MTRRPYNVFLDDMCEAIDKVGRYIEGLTYETFVSNDMVVDAVIRNLEIIGEAARCIPEHVRNSGPEIPWSKMTGLRNLVAHEYFGVDLSIIWQIASKNIVDTKPLIEALRTSSM